MKSVKLQTNHVTTQGLWSSIPITSESNGSPLRPLTIHAAEAGSNIFQSFVKSEVPSLSPLNSKEQTLLKQIDERVINKEYILALLQEYTGPRDKLEALLEWHLVRLNEACDGTNNVDLDKWIPFDSCETLRSTWERYKHDGWKAHVDSSRLGKESYSAQVFPGSKEIVLRAGPSEEPLPLTVGEEILHLDAIALVEHNTKLIERWICEQVGNVQFATELKEMGHSRFHWSSLFALNKLFKETTGDDIVEKMKVFLIERDAMAKKLELYRLLIKEKPEFKTKFWDVLVDSSYPIAKMSEILNRSERFNLPPKFVEQLREYTLDDLIQGIGGRSLRQISLADDENFVMPSAEEVIKVTPEWFAKKPIEGSAFYGDYAEKYARKMTEAEVDQLLLFLRQSWMSDPYRVHDNYRSYDRSLVPDPIGGGHRRCDTANLLEVYDNCKQSFKMLDIIDERFGTNHKLEVLLEMLKMLRPNKATGDYSYIVYQAAGAAIAATDGIDRGEAKAPDAIKRFFDNLSDSRLVEGFIADSHSRSRIVKLLKRSCLLPARQRPTSLIVSQICHSFIRYYQNVAGCKRSRGERLLVNHNAKAVSDCAYEYFTKIGEQLFASAFQSSEE